MSLREWTRMQGYGNVDFASFNHQKVEKNQHAWNRLERMPEPFFTPANINMAWSPAYSNQMNDLMHRSCKKISRSDSESCVNDGEKNAIDVALNTMQK